MRTRILLAISILIASLSAQAQYLPPVKLHATLDLDDRNTKLLPAKVQVACNIVNGMGFPYGGGQGMSPPLVNGKYHGPVEVSLLIETAHAKDVTEPRVVITCRLANVSYPGPGSAVLSDIPYPKSFPADIGTLVYRPPPLPH